jgi:hypothetical protein
MRYTEPDLGLVALGRIEELRYSAVGWTEFVKDSLLPRLMSGRIRA